jgi:hypothetical protein
MRRFLTIAGALVLCLALAAGTVSAQSNTLYGQEGTAADGYGTIDASGEGAATNPNSTNWKYQYGSGSWSGVYSWDGDAWVEEVSTGDENLDVECDIEMYASTTTEDNKIYFHLGNPYEATVAEKTALVSGTMRSNNGQYLGISFYGTSKDEDSFEEDGGGNYTGRIFDAMVGTVDIGGRDISSEAFDIVITMDNGTGGGYQPPVTYGAGAHETEPDCLWWAAMGPGSFNLTWKIVIEPATHQPDGNYNLDPLMVVAPAL